MTSTLTDEPIASPLPADQLRCTMTAARISLKWLGVRKALSSQQKAQAAAPFGAESEFLSAGKKLWDTRHPAFRAVTSVKHRLTSYFQGVSLPYPEPGIRLIRHADIASFDVHMTSLKAELSDAVQQLNEQFDELRQAARQRLGQLYSPADYPDSLLGLFDVEWDFPSVEPPNYLRQLAPELYEQECARARARFDEAVRLAESAFTEELGQLVSHLCERLAGEEDGRPKVFRDSAVGRLTEFFERFRTLSVRSSGELDELVTRAQTAVRGIAPQQLRTNQALRQQVASQLSGVQAALDGLLVDRPRRNIVRTHASPEADRCT
jgi:hypothetical protein